MTLPIEIKKPNSHDQDLSLALRSHGGDCSVRRSCSWPPEQLKYCELNNHRNREVGNEGSEDYNDLKNK